jgi:Matrixin
VATPLTDEMRVAARHRQRDYEARGTARRPADSTIGGAQALVCPPVRFVEWVGGRRSAAFVGGLLAFLVLVVAASAAWARHNGTRAARAGVERVVFIDHGRQSAPRAQPQATAAATDFRLLSGHPSWPAGSTIHYSVSTSGCSNDCSRATSAVDAAFDSWQVAGLTFTRASTGDEDACGGTDSVSWAPIDGPGGTLASTAVCRTLGSSKQIVGFQTVFDSGDTWSNSGANGKFDIQATTTHEEGHTTGLDHVGASRDARLTMYPFISAGDTGFRTLGCGDRLGVNALYGTNLSCAGVPLD